MKQLKVTQVRSVIGSTLRKKRTMKALGLRKISHSVIHDNTPDIRGMVYTVRELVSVEEAKKS
jgi:large subunit ribosomal protein L30